MSTHNLQKFSRVALGKNIDLEIGSAAPTDGTSGTGAGTAGPGSLYIATGTPALYINTGTKASPAWKALAEVP